jgi:hypothetical protein
MHQISAYGLWTLVILTLWCSSSSLLALQNRRVRATGGSFGAFSAVLRGSLHRNVWVPADYLFALWLAADSLPETRLDVP